MTLVGATPLMQAKFSEKAKQAMRAKMMAGSTAAKGQKRKPRDFDDDFRQAQHRTKEGWIGVPASAIRNACIDACRMAGFKMTFAKMSIFVDHDGLDETEGTPLIRLDAKEPERMERAVRNDSGVADLRVRPFWREWKLHVRVKFDTDQFDRESVVNLLMRAGIQVGIGEGRPFSKESNGLGYGTFTVTGTPSR